MNAIGIIAALIAATSRAVSGFILPASTNKLSTLARYNLIKNKHQYLNAQISGANVGGIASDIFQQGGEIFQQDTEAYLKDKDAKKAAKLAVYEVAQDISEKTSKRKMPRAVTVIVDRETGKQYIGVSQGVADASKLESSTIDRLPDDSLELWPTHNCAEVDALNKALKDGAKPENLVQHTVSIGKIKEGIAEIVDFCRCKNCEITTHDIETSSDHSSSVQQNP